jgi:hypothetical protein
VQISIYGWGIAAISFSTSFVFIALEWIEYKYLKDNEIYKAHLESIKHKKYIHFLKKSLLSDKDPFK